MNEDQEIRNALLADAEALRRTAPLPSAQGMLWRVKLRSARGQRRRAARTVALAQASCAALAALALLAWADASGFLLAASGALWASMSWFLVSEIRRGA